MIKPYLFDRTTGEPLDTVVLRSKLKEIEDYYIPYA